MIIRLLQKLKKFVITYQNFIKYCVIGLSGVVIDLGVFYALTHVFNVFYQYANIASSSCGIANNFTLNAYFNFKVKDNLLSRFAKFYSVGLFGLVLSAGILYLLVDVLKYDVLLTKLLSIVAVTFVQYNLNQRFSFRKQTVDGQS